VFVVSTMYRCCGRTRWSPNVARRARSTPPWWVPSWCDRTAQGVSWTNHRTFGPVKGTLLLCHVMSDIYSPLHRGCALQTPNHWLWKKIDEEISRCMGFTGLHRSATSMTSKTA